MQFIFSERRQYRKTQRRLDVFIAMLALLLTLPLLAIAVAAILLEDGGPILFRQQRVGRFGRLFMMYKIRTMSVGACKDAYKPADGSDARITRIGRILRRTSFDEIPQFFNVLRGEMSVVGPRPEMPFVVRGYERWQHLRLLAPPGITGLWQTTCRSTIPLDRPDATHRDLEYIRRASPIFDLTLVTRTVTSMLSTRGAF